MTLALLAILSACSHARYLGPAEDALGTGAHFAAPAHIAVYYPNEIALDLPGYVVGIELAERNRHLPLDDPTIVDLEQTGLTTARLLGEFRDGSLRLVSCAAVNEQGAIEGSHDEAIKVVHLDASRLIRYDMPGTDGGAHSDIFRPRAGRLMWTFLAKRPACSGTPGTTELMPR